jgi:cysteine-rich repeat protein
MGVATPITCTRGAPFLVAIQHLLMRCSLRRASAPLTVLLGTALLSMASCTRSLVDAPCPCADGWTCCVATNRCLAAGSICPGGGDAQSNPADGCDGNCPVATCGNGVIETGEECDDGKETSSCNATCTSTRCGDGIINHAAGEECDVLGGADTTACNGRVAVLGCRLSTCGDGYVNAAAGETCDVLGGGDTATCNGSAAGTFLGCRPSACGDGYVNSAAGETCEVQRDGVDTTACNGRAAGTALGCRAAGCGDGYVNRIAGEQCESTATNGDTCASCMIVNCATNLVPTMFSATLPSGVVSRSGTFVSSPIDYEAWHAFDSIDATMWMSGANETPASLGYEWTNGPRSVKSYAITFVDGANVTRAPRDWTLEAWNGSSWNVIDIRNAETNWHGFERRGYTVVSPGSYSKYRLNTSDDNDDLPGVALVSIGRLELMGCPP